MTSGDSVNFSLWGTLPTTERENICRIIDQQNFVNYNFSSTTSPIVRTQNIR
jgi:hypothetical protein